MRERGKRPSTKQSHLRLSMLMARCQQGEDCCVQSAIVQRPWLSKFVSIMSAKAGATLELSRTSMIVSIELCSWSRRPGSVHLVRCFDVSFLHPHCGHLLMTVSSHRDSLELHPHHPDTCIVVNVRKGLGYPDMALS